MGIYNVFNFFTTIVYAPVLYNGEMILILNIVKSNKVT